MSFHKQKQKGFTLIEVIVVIAVIGLIVTLVFANYRSGTRSSNLQAAAQGLVTDIRTAQNMAMSSSKYEDEVPCGYGIHFMSNNSYFLFRDIDGDRQCSTNNKRYNPELGEEIGRVINLPADIDLKTESAFLRNDIFFMPPDPVVFFDGQQIIGTTEVIVHEHGNIENQKVIKVNNFGLVEID